MMSPQLAASFYMGQRRRGRQRWHLPGAMARGFTSGGLSGWEHGTPGVEVAALSEVRRPGSGSISKGGYTYYWSGRGYDHHISGVAIAISSRLQLSVVEMSPVDERIMALILKHSFGFVSFIAVYVTTDICKIDVKEAFYIKLISVVDKCPRRDIRIVLGNFTAVSGCDRAGYEMSVGPHGSGAYLGSENSLLLRDFARSQRLRISGSWYQRSNPHCCTWYGDTGIVAKEIAGGSFRTAEFSSSLLL
ncbi:uncharacterized protein [Penaeus vannamei]|uniref:uncharacterized protein n=1 Tax=Penaeus vannamei TaxID=6689 RepID=UPI00387F8B3D